MTTKRYEHYEWRQRCVWWAYPLDTTGLTPEQRTVRERVALLRGWQVWAGRRLVAAVKNVLRESGHSRVLLGAAAWESQTCHDQTLITPMTGELDSVRMITRWLAAEPERALVVDVTADVWRLSGGEIPEVTPEGEFRGLDGRGDVAAWEYWSDAEHITMLDALLSYADVITTSYDELVGRLEVRGRERGQRLHVMHVPDADGWRGRWAHRRAVDEALAIAARKARRRATA